MTARAEQSKNKILERIDAATLTVEAKIEDAISFVSLVTIILVMVILILLAAFCQSWILFISLAVYVLIMLFLYLQFSREYTRKRLKNARHTFTNFIASEEAITILNGAIAVYNAT